MKQLGAYLRFDGNCREAMTFYKDCLGGELSMQTVGESPMAKQLPPQAQKNIMHSSLVKGKVVLLGSDMVDPGKRTNGNSISLFIECDSEEEIKTCFAKLAAGGKVDMPLKTEFWGATFGMLTDKYGNEWMLNYEKPKA